MAVTRDARPYRRGSAGRLALPLRPDGAIILPMQFGGATALPNCGGCGI